MAIEDKKLLTFVDLQSLIDDEGFVKNHDFNATSKKCVNKIELINALLVDEQQLSSVADKRLIRRELAVKHSGVFQFMTSETDNLNSDANCNIDVTLNYDHDGNNELPMVGNTVFVRGTSTPLQGLDLYRTAQRYPSQANDRMRIRVNSSGKVTYIIWCQDFTTTPFDLVLTPVANKTTAFTIDWKSGSDYHNPGHRIIVKAAGTTLLDTVQLSRHYLFENLSPGGTYNVEIRTYKDSAGLYTYKSVTGHVTLPESHQHAIKTTGQLQDPCATESGNAVQVYCPVDPVVAGSKFYSDIDLQNLWTGSGGNWWREGLHTSYRISTGGNVDAVKTDC